MDFSFVLSPTVAIVSATLEVLTNAATPAPAPEWVVGDVTIDGRIVHARLSGGTEGVDYLLVWTAVDSDGNVFPRTAMVLCAATS